MKYIKTDLFKTKDAIGYVYLIISWLDHDYLLKIMKDSCNVYMFL